MLRGKPWSLLALSLACGPWVSWGTSSLPRSWGNCLPFWRSHCPASPLPRRSHLPWVPFYSGHLSSPEDREWPWVTAKSKLTEPPAWSCVQRASTGEGSGWPIPTMFSGSSWPKEEHLGYDRHVSAMWSLPRLPAHLPTILLLSLMILQIKS